MRLSSARARLGFTEGDYVEIFDRFKSKLRDANDAMAGAHKVWLDEDLQARQKAIIERENTLVAREAAVQKSEAGWFRRKVGFGTVAIVCAAPSLLIGYVAGNRSTMTAASAVTSSNDLANQRTATSETTSLTPSETPSPALPDPMAPTPELDAMAPAASSSSGIESTSKAMGFEQCLGEIQSYATQLGVAPVNVAETNDLRIVRFVARDGSVLITCSRPDGKMVLTRSPT